MLKSGPIILLVRALFLAAAGFLISSGAAFAHGKIGAALSHDAAVLMQGSSMEEFAADPGSTSAQHAAVTSQEQPTQTTHSGDEPCSDDGAGSHLAGGCCKVACHSALTALTPEPAGASDPPNHYVRSLSDMLVGRPGIPSERPPKRV